MKAIINIAPPGTIFETARAQLAAAQGRNDGADTHDADYIIHFNSARQLLAQLTGTRMELLDRLRRMEPCSVYALAKAAGRNYSNVHRDVAALEALALIERDDDGQVLVPFDVVEIRLGLAAAA